MDRENKPRCECGSFKLEDISSYPILDQRDRLFHCFSCGKRTMVCDGLKMYSTAQIITQLESERDKYKADAVEMAKSIEKTWYRFEMATFEELQEGGHHERYCIHCATDNPDRNSNNHDKDCIVLKAEQLLSDNKEG